MLLGKIKKPTKQILKITLTIAAIYIVVNKIDMDRLWYHIKEMNLMFLLLSILVFIFAKIIEALRINNYYRKIGIKLSEWQNIRLYWLGLFYNLFLPGGISGDGYKVYWLKSKKNSDLKETIWATLINRLNGFLGILILLAITSELITLDYPYKQYVFLLIPLFYFLFYIGLRIFYKNFIPVLPKTTIQSVIIQILQVVCIQLLISGMGIHGHFVNYWFLFLASSIVFVIPITLGGFGSREVVFVLAADYMHIDVTAAIAMSLMIYFIRAIVSFTGIYFMLYPEKILKKRFVAFSKELRSQ